MKCATCGAENADDSIFCVECGAMLVSAPSVPEEPGFLCCPECGAENADDAIFCTQCGTILEPAPSGPASEAQLAASAEPVTGETPPALQLPAKERPGCVTAYAILQGISAVLAAIGGVFLLGSDSATTGVFTIGSAALSGVVAVGLWRLRNWARILLLILLGLGLAVNGLNSVLSLGGSGEPATLTCITGILALAVSGYIFYWFAKHREYFD